jgi:non-ribosomal peptide synthetase component F
MEKRGSFTLPFFSKSEDEIPASTIEWPTAVRSGKRLSISPIGMPGELWIGGEGLTWDSDDRLDLTREEFFDNPFGHGRVAIAVLISLSNARSSLTVQTRRKSRSEGVFQSTALEMIIIGDRRGDCAISPSLIDISNITRGSILKC